VALRLIHDLEFKNSQQISEDDLCTVVKAVYPKEYPNKTRSTTEQQILESLLHCRVGHVSLISGTCLLALFVRPNSLGVSVIVNFAGITT
jgi:hypothetical protein